MLEVQKTTKISIARYLQIMQRQLEGKIAETIKFNEIPNITEVYRGRIEKPFENTTNLLVFNMKMHCRRMVSEGGSQCGELSLEGLDKWGGQDLKFRISLLKDFTFPTPEDLLLLPFQEIQIKIPPTQLTFNTENGSFKINFSDNNVKWEEEKNIRSRMAKILTDRKTHQIKPGNDVPMLEPSCMPPTPIRYQQSFNPDWGWQDQPNTGGWIQRGQWLPRMGVQGPRYGELQYSQPVRTDQHDVGGVRPSMGAIGDP